jgi:hypothetical protein
VDDREIDGGGDNDKMSKRSTGMVVAHLSNRSMGAMSNKMWWPRERAAQSYPRDIGKCGHMDVHRPACGPKVVACVQNGRSPIKVNW